ncbi:AMP-binding protein [Desulfuromonas acetoxidans]|nr:AMP-binding protein [Desulfuromonas acetoxidans]MBF0644298.1 AMP-binding protein [Desulfuromonas acetoxidans]NVD24832.1 AMP-binding protein [Desulfuromonas acetoxidans]NVE15133.1 AMP-binding protein [Desulfuromonas acetoxidans]
MLIDQVETVCGLLSRRVECSGAERCLFFKEERQWRGLTWDEFNDLLDKMMAYLHQAGCRPGDRIGIMAKTSLLWDLCHYAILKLGGVVVGLDPHDTAENVVHIIGQAKIRGVFVDSDALEEKMAAHDGALFFILQGEYCYADGLRISGQERSAQGDIPLAKVAKDSPATIIFTSGTTGTSKGIVYSHTQVIQACRAILSRYHDVASDAHLPCWLPLSNLFQRMLNFAGISVGAKLFYVANPMEIVQQLPEINPDVLIGVPRFYEKVHEGVMQTMNRQPWPVRKLFAVCLYLRRANAVQETSSGPGSWKQKLADLLVLKRVRQRIFGTRLLYVISGSAPMPLWLLRWYQSLGVLVLEAYGISENIIPIACNSLDGYRFGTVGKVLQENTVHVAEDGEIFVKGPGVFEGYLTGDAQDKLTLDGFLKTGDEGSLDAEGFVTLQGRKSDFFKTSTGKRVSPMALEAALLQLDAFEHVLVIGEGRKVPIILATLAQESGKGLAEVESHVVRAKINALAKEMFPSGLRPAAAVLLPHSFTLAGGELTANLKLRRKVISEKYAQLIDDVYQRISAKDLPVEDIYILEDSQGGIVRL